MRDISKSNRGGVGGRTDRKLVKESEKKYSERDGMRRV